MAFRTKLVRAEAQILSSLRTTPGRIYARSELAATFYKAKRDGTLAKHTKLDELIDHLVLRRHLLSITLESKLYEKKITRYCAGTPSPFQLAASLRKNGYVSHGTAAYLHGLIKTPPDAIYLNIEQSAKPLSEKSLSQVTIDRAFASKQRQSKFFYANKDLIVTILAGKNTDRTGVQPIAHAEARDVPATNLERTLIDIAVRPAYSGGIDQVLSAYRGASHRVSIDALISTLDRIDHAYPYAQSIGFLMQRAGYTEEQLKPLKSRISEFKFYLTHGMTKPAYDENWRLFHPIGI